MIKCDKCEGYIPDVIIGEDRKDCKNHLQPEVNFTHPFKPLHFDRNEKRY